MFDPDLVSIAGPGDQYLHNLTISGSQLYRAERDNCVLIPPLGSPDILAASNLPAAVAAVTRVVRSDIVTLTSTMIRSMYEQCESLLMTRMIKSVSILLIRSGG